MDAYYGCQCPHIETEPIKIFFHNFQSLQKLIYLHLFTDCFMKISVQSSEQIYSSGNSNISMPYKQ